MMLLSDKMKTNRKGLSSQEDEDKDEDVVPARVKRAIEEIALANEHLAIELAEWIPELVKDAVQACKEEDAEAGDELPAQVAKRLGMIETVLSKALGKKGKDLFGDAQEVAELDLDI